MVSRSPSSARDDTETVVKAIRLGWAVAEFRGRSRPNASGGAARPESEWPCHALPLTEERSSLELGIEVERVLASLAVDMNVDLGPHHTGPGLRTFSSTARSLAFDIKGVSEELAKAPLDIALLSRRQLLWNQLAEQVYLWDAAIQDALAIDSVDELAGYNLGRALAETYWSLNTVATSDLSTSWAHLFGQERRGLINEYLGRLAGHFDPITPPAISGSLSTWSAVASTAPWRSALDCLPILREQVRRWYGLLVLRQNAQTFLQPQAILRNWRATRTAVRAFLPELIVLGGGIVATATLVALISTGNGATWTKSLLGILSALGLSSATITSRLKASTKNLTTRLRNEATTDAVAIGLTVVPSNKVSRSLLPGSDKRAASRSVRLTTRARAISAVD